MNRAQRIRRASKWTGLAICTLTAAAWLISLVSDSHVTIRGYTCQLYGGYLWFDNYAYIGFGWWFKWLGGCVQSWTRFGFSLPDIMTFGSPTWGARIPLWALMLPTGVSTGWLWYRDRNRTPPGHCSGCGYDLTGNVSGICPECGSGIGSPNNAYAAFLMQRKPKTHA